MFVDRRQSVGGHTSPCWNVRAVFEIRVVGRCEAIQNAESESADQNGAMKHVGKMLRAFVIVAADIADGASNNAFKPMMCLLDKRAAKFRATFTHGGLGAVGNWRFCAPWHPRCEKGKR